MTPPPSELFRKFIRFGNVTRPLFTSAIISAETCQMVLNSILANICTEKNWGDEKFW